MLDIHSMRASERRAGPIARDPLYLQVRVIYHELLLSLSGTMEDSKLRWPVGKREVYAVVSTRKRPDILL